MYTPPPPADAAAGPTRGGLAASGPILAVCCLLFILFLIASTIALALIPVYVASTSGSSQSRSSTYTATLTAQNATFSEISLDQTSRDNIAAAITAASNLPTGSIIAPTGVASESGGSRRRRGFGLVRERRLGTKMYTTLTFDLKKCNKCSNMGFLKTIQTVYIVARVSINYLGASTVSSVLVRFYVVINYTQSTIPQTSTASTSTLTTAMTG